MKNWKTIAEQKIRSTIAKEKKEEAEKTERRTQEKSRQKALRLEEFGNKYKCYICGKKSDGPEYIRDSSHLEHGGSSGYYIWNPMDSTSSTRKCSECNKWVCEDHFLVILGVINQPLCMHCADDL